MRQGGDHQWTVMGKFNGFLQLGAGEIEFTLLLVGLTKDQMRPFVGGFALCTSIGGRGCHQSGSSSADLSRNSHTFEYLPTGSELGWREWRRGARAARWLRDSAGAL